MLKELYCRNEDDPYYDPTYLETSNPIEALLTKIRMIIYTKKSEVFGYPDLGLNLETLLFELKFTGAQLQADFERQISQYCPEAVNYNIKLEINFVPGTIRDICYLDIYIDGTKYLGIVAK